MSNNSGQTSYVTRGARMICTNGTHRRRLNLEEDHGYHIEHGNDGGYKHPIAIASDSKVDVNIKSFGVCAAEGNDSENIVLFKEGEQPPDGETVNGPRCIPLIDTNWIDPKFDAVMNGDELLVTTSCLTCKHGGLILFETNGLEYEGDLD